MYYQKRCDANHHQLDGAELHHFLHMLSGGDSKELVLKKLLLVICENSNVHSFMTGTAACEQASNNVNKLHYTNLH